ncbi:MAG: amidohydrolase family protein [Ekhidna sp.]
MKKMFSTALMLMLLLNAFSASDTLLITNGNIVRPSEKDILENHDVLIVDQRIIKIASDQVAKPHYKVIDAKGKYLIPGLFDMHVHLERLEESNLRSFVEYGIVTVRNMDGRQNILNWKDQILKNELLGPDIFSAGPIIEGAAPYWKDTRVVKSKKEAIKEVNDQVTAGYDFIKVYHTLSKSSYLAILQESAIRNIRVIGHVPYEISILDAIKNGQSCVEHFDGYSDHLEADHSPFKGRWDWKKLFFAFPIDSSKIDKLVSITSSYGVANVPTLVVRDKISSMKVIKERYQDPEIKKLPKEVQDSWRPEKFNFVENLTSDDYSDLNLGKSNKLLLVKKLHDNGCTILAGSDTPNPYVLPGRSLHEELLLLSESGITTYDVLSTATDKPAEWLELHDQGKIQETYRADIIILNENPIENIANTQSIQTVILKGEVMK